MDGVSPLTYFLIGLPFLVLLFAFGAGKIAAKQGRNSIGWFLLSLIVTPFAVIFLLLLMGESTSSAVKKSSGTKEVVKVRCSQCGEAVEESARFCPQCGSELRTATT